MRKIPSQKTNMIPIDANNQNDTLYYYNVIYLSYKVQCESCKKDISKQTKAMFADRDYCISCFTNLREHPERYHIIGHLLFPLFDVAWTAEEELQLLEGINNYGFGNWEEIAQHFLTAKTVQEIQSHYKTYYLQRYDQLPKMGTLTKRDSKGKLIISTKAPSKKKSTSPHKEGVKLNQPQKPHLSKKGCLSLSYLGSPNSSRSTSNPAQIVGYLPKRGQFQVEYDNYAENLISQLEFNDDDSEEQLNMKYRLIQIYNARLTERVRRKQFIINRKILDIQEQQQLNRQRTKQEKDFYNVMKPFARYNDPDNHDRLVKGLFREKKIRERIKYINQLQAKGFQKLYEGEQSERIKKQIEIPTLQQIPPIKGKRMRKQSNSHRDQNPLHSKQQQNLCSKYNITPQQYSMMKQTIIREAVKQGIIKKGKQGLKCQRNVVDALFEIEIKQKPQTQESSSGSQQS